MTSAGDAPHVGPPVTSEAHHFGPPVTSEAHHFGPPVTSTAHHFGPPAEAAHPDPMAVRPVGGGSYSNNPGQWRFTPDATVPAGHIHVDIDAGAIHKYN